MTQHRAFPALFVLVAAVLTGCGSLVSMPKADDAFANKPEAVVRSALGKPSQVFAGHYGAPPVDFTRRFTGEIKTLVFKKPGGEYYISFEKRPGGWVSICSSWLPDGGVF